MASIQVIHISDNPRPSRTIRSGKPSLAEAASDRGIDAQRAIRNLRQRARYHQHLDRPKVFPCSDTAVGLYTWHSRPDQASRDLAELRNTTDTGRYVAMFCRLNHLKEC